MKIGRNGPCPCGSGKKFKHCCFKKIKTSSVVPFPVADKPFEPPERGKPFMERVHFMAAEIFSYSFDNYRDHMNFNARFDKYMPEDVPILEQAIDENWPHQKIALKLDTHLENVPDFVRATKDARLLVDAPNLGVSFHHGVIQSIKKAVEEGLSDDASIEALATQICFRAADLSVMLDQEGSQLQDYSKQLRKEIGDWRTEE